jgi:hypothetical protein
MIGLMAISSEVYEAIGAIVGYFSLIFDKLDSFLVKVFGS